jgi:hypothetical protein
LCGTKIRALFFSATFFLIFFLNFFLKLIYTFAPSFIQPPYFMLHEEIKGVLALAHKDKSSEQVGQLLGTSHQWVRLLRRRLPKSIDLIDRLLNAHGFRLAVVKIEPESPAE